MQYEVELKFRVESLAPFPEKLRAFDARQASVRIQKDGYLNHPSRDFAQTDEALRLRSDELGSRVTYKGPKVDSTTKTRREIELPLGEAKPERWLELLTALGFRPVAEVVKRREYWNLTYQGADVEIGLDQVDGVGSFVELELAADEETLDAARQLLESLSRELGLAERERRSYLELLLENRS